MMTIEEACEIMHDAYEEAAVAAGWETQERSRKPWTDVPEANKETMRAAVRALLVALTPEIKAQGQQELITDLLARELWSVRYVENEYPIQAVPKSALLERRNRLARQSTTTKEPT